MATNSFLCIALYISDAETFRALWQAENDNQRLQETLEMSGLSWLVNMDRMRQHEEFERGRRRHERATAAENRMSAPAALDVSTINRIILLTENRTRYSSSHERFPD